MNNSLNFFGMLVFWLGSRRNLKFIELVGSGLTGSSCIIMAFCNYTGLIKMDDNRFIWQLIFCFFYYLLYTGLLTTQFYYHVLPRIFWYIASLIVSIIARYRANGEPTAYGFIFCMILMLICELIFFVQEKAQVKLFVANKVIKL